RDPADVRAKVLGEVLLDRGVELEDLEPVGRSERLRIDPGKVRPVETVRSTRDARDPGSRRSVGQEREGPALPFGSYGFGRGSEKDPGLREHVEPAGPVGDVVVRPV